MTGDKISESLRIGKQIKWHGEMDADISRNKNLALQRHYNLLLERNNRVVLFIQFICLLIN